MKQPIYYLILFCLCSFQFELLGQLDQCKGLPPYFLKKGINPEKAYYSDYRKSGFIRAKRILSSVGKNGIERILDNDFYQVKTTR